MKSAIDENQQALAYTERLNFVLRQVAQLSSLPLEGQYHTLDSAGVILSTATEWLSGGRVQGVIELLQRLTILSREIGADSVVVAAQVSALAARITGRKSTSERTVRNWTRDAVALGLLQVDHRSHQFGGSAWNVYTIFLVKLRDLIQPVESQLGRTRAEPGGNHFRPWGGNGFRPIKSEDRKEKILSSTETESDSSKSVLPSPPHAARLSPARVPPRSQTTSADPDTSQGRFYLERLRRKLRIRPDSKQDFDFVVRTALLCERGLITQSDLFAALEATDRKAADNPIAYFTTCLDTALGGQLQELISQLPSSR